MLFVFFLLVSSSLSSLLDDRYYTAKIWILRSKNASTLANAFTDNFTTPETQHTVQDVGDFGPRDVAIEYDSIITSLVLFLGYNPIVLNTYIDLSTTKWLNDDTLQIDSNIDISTNYNLTTGNYDLIQTGFRNREYIVFQPNTSRVLLGFTVQDEAASRLFALSQGEIPIEYICHDVIIPACNGTAQIGYRPFLPDTEYTSVADCINVLSTKLTSPCPFQQRSDTARCRMAHGQTSFFDPAYHCSHTRPISMRCVDTCLPACSACDANAECVATFPTLFTPVYQCKCKNGYVGNGTSCTPKQCSYGQCPSMYGSYECSTGLCKCRESFTTNPMITSTSNDLCRCDAPSRIIYNGSTPVCVPEGRCVRDQYECNLQSYNQVKCKSVGDNMFTNLKSCQCNYGFTGGYEYPCMCASPKRVVWSDTHSGEVCLGVTECTANWHCGYPLTCHILPGNTTGSCY